MNVKQWMAMYAVAYAKDNSHGYTNDYPDNQWWRGLDVDCGSFMSLCIHMALLKINIDTGYQYFEPQGGWSIYNEAFLLRYCDRFNYVDVRNEVGDILVSGGHTVMITAVDPDYITHAANDYDGRTGDSSGNEIKTQKLYDGGWHYIYRLKNQYNKELDGGSDTEPADDNAIIKQLPTLKLGSTGNQVKNLQALLNLWTTQDGTFKSITMDGDFGPETETRLKAYQALQGLTIDGICGTQTWTDILETLITLQLGSTGNQVKNLQALLNLWMTQGGVYRDIVVDGYFGEETKSRLEAYQEIQNLDIDGICGPKSWADILLA